MASSGGNVRYSVFGWCRVVAILDLTCLCGVVCSGDNVRFSVFVWRVVVTMSELVCLCGVYWY